MTRITAEERAEYVEEVKDLQRTMVEAVIRLTDIVREVGDKHTEAYLLATLQIAVDCDHGYYTNDDNLTKFIERLENPEDDDPDDDEPEEDRPGKYIQTDDGVVYEYPDLTTVDLPDDYQPPPFEGGKYMQDDEGRWLYEWADGSVWSFADSFQGPVNQG